MKLLIDAVARKHSWEWGRDYAIIVTTDAVHYGNEEWGGSDYAFFGCDSAGNSKALMCFVLYYLWMIIIFVKNNN